MGNCEVFTDVRPPYTAQLPCWGDMPRERWVSWPIPDCPSKKRAAHVIEALTEQVAPEYLSYLQNQGVSYLFAGEKRLNCTLLLEKLHRLFGINKLMLAGGGIVNGSFLAENLVDELSLVIAPVADGGNGVSSFTQVDFLPSWPPTAFHLKEVQTVVPNVLWVRYTRP